MFIHMHVYFKSTMLIVLDPVFVTNDGRKPFLSDCWFQYKVICSLLQSRCICIPVRSSRQLTWKVRHSYCAVPEL